jgi:trk system potassium uptake protein TrkA
MLTGSHLLPGFRRPRTGGAPVAHRPSEARIHVVIMGCGRVGSLLAHGLTRLGHTVAVIDQVEAAFRRLGPDFPGDRILGVGFDRDTLHEAGIERAEAFIAVSSGDNSNIISARVARETFGVSRVVARIYDPRRAEVYQRLGIPTVATVRWTADQILRTLLPETMRSDWTDATGNMLLAALPYDPSWIGQRVERLERDLGERVAYVSRLGRAFLPDRDTMIQDGDEVHVLTTRERLLKAWQRCRDPIRDR